MSVDAWWPWWLAAYMVGSIPIGFLLARAKGVDIRKHGSGNIGATNVWRVLGPRVGAACFSLDVLKGLGPVLGAGLVNGVARNAPGALPTSTVALMWMGVAASAIAGHMFPVWLKFKGGKGVATGFGALLGVWPVITAAAAGALAVWIVTAKATKYVGISSCLAAVTMPLWVFLAGWAVRGSSAGLMAAVWPYALVATLLAIVVVYKHRGNIRRTLDGTERRIGERVKVEAAGKAGV